MPSTPNYNLSYPTVGSDQDSWGGTLNNTIISIDTNLKTVSDAIPTSIVASSITDTPNNFTSSASKFVKVNSAGNAIEFVTASVNDLSDVTVSNVQTGQVLKWNGSAFTNQADASASGGIALTDLSVATAGQSGGGALSYNSSNGVFTYTPPALATYLNTSNVIAGYTSQITSGGAVGSYAILAVGTGGASSGSTYSGLTIGYYVSGSAGYGDGLTTGAFGNSASGTWRAMGTYSATNSNWAGSRYVYGLFLRIS